MVSVIIPTYNYGRYISEAIASLLSQTYTDWECIIIDDGSTDNTKNVADEWVKKDKRISYFQQQNAGPTAARNNGIAKAKGDYILFLDADDLIQTEKLKSHVDVLENDKNVDIAYGDVRYFDETKPGKLFYSLRTDDKTWTTKFSGKGHLLVDTVIKQNVMVTSSPLIRKRVLQQSGGFDAKLIKLEDWELFQRWAIDDYCFRFVDAPQSLVLMRAHATSFSYDKKGMRSYFLPILEKHSTNNKLNLKNRIYVLVRMIEEYSDLSFALISDSKYPPRHYYNSYKILLPLLSLLCLPFYLLIKIFRLTRNTFQHE
jgi:glycosyltransferase involved in cell wall biosynthesis